MTDTSQETKEPINWFAEVRGLALMLLAVLGFHSFVAKPFYIPSTSMVPNLMVGDRLVVSKYPYGWSWVSASFHLLPRDGWRIWPATPEYGDIVIAVPPTRDEDYIKRVVGLPGDTIEVRNGQLILNGKPVPREVEPAVRIPVDDAQICDGGAVCLFYFSEFSKVLEDGREVYEIPVMRETLPNGANYLVIDPDPAGRDYGPAVIPDGHIFMMGDNRDHSADSRFEEGSQGLGGPVPLENVGGRAEFITFSLDGTATWNPLSWIGALRGDRAWTTLRPSVKEDVEQQ